MMTKSVCGSAERRPAKKARERVRRTGALPGFTAGLDEPMSGICLASAFVVAATPSSHEEMPVQLGLAASRRECAIAQMRPRTGGEAPPLHFAPAHRVEKH